MRDLIYSPCEQGHHKASLWCLLNVRTWERRHYQATRNVCLSLLTFWSSGSWWWKIGWSTQFPGGWFYPMFRLAWSSGDYYVRAHSHWRLAEAFTLTNNTLPLIIMLCLTIILKLWHIAMVGHHQYTLPSRQTKAVDRHRSLVYIVSVSNDQDCHKIILEALATSELMWPMVVM